MEDLIAFLAFVIFAGISVVSKIINAKKKQDNFTRLSVPVKKTVAPHNNHSGQKIRQSLQQYSAMPTKTAQKQQSSSASRKAFLETRHEMQKKESLIQEEPENIEPKEPQSVPEVPPLLPIETPASSYSSIADSLKANRKFAIVCHEILGKPKALED